MNFTELLTKHWAIIIFLSFCLVTAIQLFYYAFFFSRLAFYKKEKKHQSHTNPISVIICARDEAANLVENLPKVLTQNYKTTHEIIVVNDNSFDDTKYLLQDLKKEYKQLHVVELLQEAMMIQGKKFPLSIGIKTAKHEIILLTDADCEPASEEWIQSMQDAYSPKTDIVLGYGAYRKENGLLNKLIRWETYHAALQYMSYALAGIPYMGVGRNLSYKKSIFFKHKGFASHNKIVGGDDDLFVNMVATKENTAINIDKESFTISKPASSWKEWRNQKARHYSVSKYYKPVHKRLLFLYSFAQFIFYPLLIISAIFYNWQIALSIFGIKVIFQSVIFYKTMDKLGEKDLFAFSFFLDLWMFVYYLMYAPALIKKPRVSWN